MKAVLVSVHVHLYKGYWSSAKEEVNVEYFWQTEKNSQQSKQQNISCLNLDKIYSKKAPTSPNSWEWR